MKEIKELCYSTAEFDDVVARKYRYSLTRVWDQNQKEVVFILLNPSKADAVVSDATTDFCVEFAKKIEGTGKIRILNLFARIATKKEQLWSFDKPCDETENTLIGAKNREQFESLDKSNVSHVIVGWGSGISKKRFKIVRSNIESASDGIQLECLTEDSEKNSFCGENPRHPAFFVRKGIKPENVHLIAYSLPNSNPCN